VPVPALRVQKVVRPGGEPELNLRIFTISLTEGVLADWLNPGDWQPYRVQQWKVNGSYVQKGWLKMAGDLAHARRLIPGWADTKMARSEYDEAAIVESWL
jgi:hypothetical protein